MLIVMLYHFIRLSADFVFRYLIQVAINLLPNSLISHRNVKGADGITEGFSLLHKFSPNPLLSIFAKKSTVTSNHPISRYSHVCTGLRYKDNTTIKAISWTQAFAHHPLPLRNQAGVPYPRLKDYSGTA